MRPLLPLLGLLLAQGCASKDGTDTDPTATGDNPGNEGPLQYVPVAGWDNFPFEDFPVLSYIPSDPIAIAYGFHGSNGSVGYCNKSETTALLNELVLADIGFVCTESTDRQSGQWDNSSNFDTNPDTARLLRLHEHIIETTDITADMPIVTFGFSNGGSASTNMSEFFDSEGYRAKVAAPHMSSGQAWGRSFPIAWVIAVNDPQPEGESASADLAAAGIPTDVHFCEEVPLSVEFLTRDGGMNVGTAETVISEAIRLELIGEDGMRIFPVEEAENWLKTYEREANVNSVTLHTEDMRVAFALHRMNGMYAREIRDFFLKHM